MDLFDNTILNTVSLLVLLTVLVFVHEFGHFWVARKNGVKVEVFSVGFGKELCRAMVGSTFVRFWWLAMTNHWK